MLKVNIILCFGVAFWDLIPNSSCSMHQSSCLFNCSSALWNTFGHQISERTGTHHDYSEGKSLTLTSSVSSCLWLSSAELGFCCGSLLSEGFFFSFFFFFLAFDCADCSGGELTSFSFSREGFSPWSPFWWLGEVASGVSVVSMFSTGVTGGIWKSKAKAEPCPVKEIWLAVVSVLSDDAAVSSWSAEELSEKKLNLKVFSLRVQRGFSALVSAGAELFDCGSISVKLTFAKKKKKRRITC